MVEKNIVGKYNISDEYPVFKADDVEQGPLVSPVSRVGGIDRIQGVQGVISTFEPLEQWRVFSEMLRDRRQGPSRQPPSAPTPPRPAAQTQRDQHFQKEYEQDMVDISTHSDPLFLQLQRYLSQVNHEHPDIHKTTYETPDTGFTAAPTGILRVADVMTQRVVCVLESTPIEQVASICNRRRITGIPVVTATSRSLVGIVTLTDILNQIVNRPALETLQAHGEILRQTALAVLDEPVRNFMHSPVFTVPPECSVREACQLMTEKKIRRVVVTQGDLVRGIFSAQDAVRILARADLSTV
jgi:CBS domain-containing protein